MTKAVSMKT